jgi:transposase InsO family protein
VLVVPIVYGIGQACRFRADGHASVAPAVGSGTTRRTAPTKSEPSEWFRSRTEAKIVIEAWRRLFTTVGIHLSVNYLTPTGLAANVRE